MLELLRWGPDAQVCPHCAVIGGHWFLKPRNGVSRQTRTGAETQRPALEVLVVPQAVLLYPTGTVMHRTKIPVRKWLFVLFEMCTSKNGVAAREIERKYSLTPKAAWFMVHRIREAMATDPLRAVSLSAPSKWTRPTSAATARACTARTRGRSWTRHPS